MLIRLAILYGAGLRKIDGIPKVGLSMWNNQPTPLTIAAVEDTAPIEAVLMACHQGHLEEVKQNITSIDEKDASWMSATLAFLALKERRADILQFCFDQGNFPFESFFEEEANRVKKDKDPETFEVLEKSRFREMHPRKARHYKKYRRNESPRTRAAGTFDSGGSHPIPW